MTRQELEKRYAEIKNGENEDFVLEPDEYSVVSRIKYYGYPEKYGVETIITLNDGREINSFNTVDQGSRIRVVYKNGDYHTKHLKPYTFKHTMFLIFAAIGVLISIGTMIFAQPVINGISPIWANLIFAIFSCMGGFLVYHFRTVKSIGGILMSLCGWALMLIPIGLWKI